MSVFKKDLSFDLDEYLLKKYNLILDRSSRVSPELQKKIELEIEKELKKMSAFSGEFRCEIQDSHIHIPWNIDTSKEIFVWMLTVANKKEKIVFTYADRQMDVGDGSVLQQDTCRFSEKGDWIIPKTVLEFLNTNECVWIGSGGYAELLSVKDHDAMHTARDIEDLLKKLQ